MVESAQQQAYLDGALAANTGMVETELDQGWFTKNWAKAGYRDTLGRLALSDYDASVSADMARMREQSPKEMQKYLRRKRAGLMKIMQGMTLKSRNELFPKLLTAERAAVAEHAKQHSEYMNDMYLEGLRTHIGTKLTKMNNTQGMGDDSYWAATDDAFMTIVTDVWQNDNLPAETKSRFMKEAVLASMDEGNVGLYQRMQTVEFDDGDGNMYTLLEQMSFDDRSKLGSKYHSTLTKHGFKVAEGWHREQRNIEMAINAGMIDRLDYKQVEGHLDSGIRAGYISPEKGNSVLKQFAVRSKEEADEASVITAVQNGDFTALRDIGVSQSEAAKKFVGYHVEKASGMEDPEDRVSVY